MNQESETPQHGFSIAEFEHLLTRFKVNIESIHQNKNGICHLIGYINNKKHLWDKNGKYFYRGRPRPEYNIFSK